MSESRIERKVLALDGVETRGGGGEHALPTSYSGHASAFFVPDQSWYTDIIAPGAFADYLPQFLARGFVGGMNHDWCQPIGRPLPAVEDAKGLAVEASISHTGHGTDVARLL